MNHREADTGRGVNPGQVSPARRILEELMLSRIEFGETGRELEKVLRLLGVPNRLDPYQSRRLH
ncbi:MAG: hypothetical protein KDI44_02835 [Thiothrix sp.]|nr:hypothetical protein [Thiothrix sp.]HPQ95374.1 hypothetical protein [Thiolinea sp.]